MIRKVNDEDAGANKGAIMKQAAKAMKEGSLTFTFQVPPGDGSGCTITVPRAISLSRRTSLKAPRMVWTLGRASKCAVHAKSTLTCLADDCFNEPERLYFFNHEMTCDRSRTDLRYIIHVFNTNIVT